MARVVVRPTHRRQGIFRTIVEGTLRDAHERGLALSSLRATDARLYGRFGYGLAGTMAAVELDPTRVAFRLPVAPGTLRQLAPDEIVATVTDIYNAHGRWRAGAINRPEWMWRRYLADALTGESARWVVAHYNDDGVADGFVDYESELAQNFAGPGTATITVLDVIGADAAVERALWSFVASLDLATVIRAEERAVDSAVPLALVDYDAWQVRSVTHEQWLRILDVDAALRARTYRPGRYVYIEVSDELFPANNGVWQVGGSIERVDEPPHLSCDVAALSMAYLGGSSWTQLVRAGLAIEHEPGACEFADHRWGTSFAPHCGSFF
jgi:predicted acetyltransferase